MVLLLRQELFTGDHTRSIAMSTPSSAAGGMMKFAKKTHRCMSCKAALPDLAGGAALCALCGSKQGEIYVTSLSKVNRQWRFFSSLLCQEENKEDYTYKP